MKISEKFIKNILEQDEDVYGPEYDDANVKEKRPGLIRRTISGVGRGVSAVGKEAGRGVKGAYDFMMSEPESPSSDYDIITPIKNIAKQVIPGGPVGAAALKLVGKNVIEPTARGMVKVKRAILPSKYDEQY